LSETCTIYVITHYRFKEKQREGEIERELHTFIIIIIIIIIIISYCYMLAFLLKEKLYLFEHPRVFIPFLSRAYKKIHFFDLREEKNWKKKRDRAL